MCFIWNNVFLGGKLSVGVIVPFAMKVVIYGWEASPIREGLEGLSVKDKERQEVTDLFYDSLKEIALPLSPQPSALRHSPSALSASPPDPSPQPPAATFGCGPAQPWPWPSTALVQQSLTRLAHTSGLLPTQSPRLRLALAPGMCRGVEQPPNGRRLHVIIY